MPSNNSSKPISLNDITLTLADVAEQNKTTEHTPYSGSTKHKNSRPVKINFSDLKYI